MQIGLYMCPSGEVDCSLCPCEQYYKYLGLCAWECYSDESWGPRYADSFGCEVGGKLHSRIRVDDPSFRVAFANCGESHDKLSKRIACFLDLVIYLDMDSAMLRLVIPSQVSPR